MPNLDLCPKLVSGVCGLPATGFVLPDNSEIWFGVDYYGDRLHGAFPSKAACLGAMVASVKMALSKLRAAEKAIEDKRLSMEHTAELKRLASKRFSNDKEFEQKQFLEKLRNELARLESHLAELEEWWKALAQKHRRKLKLEEALEELQVAEVTSDPAHSDYAEVLESSDCNSSYVIRFVDGTPNVQPRYYYKPFDGVLAELKYSREEEVRAIFTRNLAKQPPPPNYFSP